MRKGEAQIIRKFSPKQLKLLSWWCPQSSYQKYDGVICDGAVRSGKTLCMALSFFMWSMSSFQNQNFAICGKTISSVKRNVFIPIRPLFEELGFCCQEKVSQNYIEVRCKNRVNRYYFFSGMDAGKASIIQGITLAGALFDEVALQERSFVEQAVARCSVEGSRYWFNCNPEHPQHWFYTDWICKREEKNLCYFHFLMQDNPGLSRKMRKRYESLYSGNFYRRFVQGEWISPEGIIYPMFSKERHIVKEAPRCERYLVSCDYGTVNPCSIGLWGESGGIWYRLREYYHDSRKEGFCRTDEEHYEKLAELCRGLAIEAVIVDPSAASFSECIKRHGKFKVIAANNQVIQGIGQVSSMLQNGTLKFCEGCKDSIREFGMYRWNETAGKDQPIKENDHAMDDIRYFVMEICKKTSGFFAIAKERNERN